MKSIPFLHNHSKLEVTYLLGSTPFPEIVTTGITHYSIFSTWSQPRPSFATGESEKNLETLRLISLDHLLLM